MVRAEVQYWNCFICFYTYPYPSFHTLLKIHPHNSKLLWLQWWAHPSEASCFDDIFFQLMSRIITYKSGHCFSFCHFFLTAYMMGELRLKYSTWHLDLWGKSFSEFKLLSKYTDYSRLASWVMWTHYDANLRTVYFLKQKNSWTKLKMEFILSHRIAK